MERSGMKKLLLIAAALAACVFSLYARTFGYSYVWDDAEYLYKNHFYSGVRGIVRALSEPFFVRGYYRPLAVITFAFSEKEAVQHAINVLLHALNTVLVFLCARALMLRAVAESRVGVAAAALGALVFAVHPVGVEATVWVSGRFDTLMCTFVLCVCLVALGGKLTRRGLALVFVLFFAAMCSKEAAIGLPVALPLLLLLKWRQAGVAMDMKEQGGRLARLLAVLALAAALYVAARLAVVHTMFVEDAQVTFRSESFVDKINIAALAVTEFVKLLVNPWSHSAPLHPLSYEAGSGLLPQTVVVLGVVVVLLATVFLKKPRLNFPLALLAGLAMGWPALHLIGIPNGENIISDRYALAPLALLLVALAATAGAWLARRVPAMGAGEKRVLAYAGVFGLLWAGALTAHSHVTIPLWRNDNVLWNFAHTRVPESKLAHDNYISELIRQERWKDADAEMNKRWGQYPYFRENMEISDGLNWMLVRANVGDYAGAMDMFVQVERNLAGYTQRGEDVNILLADLYRNRGLIEAGAKNWERAAYFLEKSLEIVPVGAGGRTSAFRYAEALFMTGHTERAEQIFNRALAKAPAEEAAWALEWRKTWRLPAAGGASTPASAAVP